MEIKTQIKTIRYIEYDGHKFYEDQKGYWLGHINGKRKRLHIYVWEKFNGPIPEGYHIHHKDFNSDNNDIDNLELLSEAEHLSLHGQLERNVALARRNLIKHARPKASEYHKSPIGRAWARENFKTSLAPLLEQKILQTCVVCGNEFYSCGTKPNAKFCSNSCKSKFRRDSGIDDEVRNCITCGKGFITDKYSKAKTCSKSCAMRSKRKSE